MHFPLPLLSNNNLCFTYVIAKPLCIDTAICLVMQERELGRRMTMLIKLHVCEPRRVSRA